MNFGWRFPEAPGEVAVVRDLSLHVMDLVENSVRAGASVIFVTIDGDPEADLLQITIEDDGKGLAVSPEQAADPFYTTKTGKRTGLGLSLFRATAEQAGGMMTLTPSSMGGLKLYATMQMSHVDRSPVGDLSATFSALMCTNPNITFRIRVRLGTQECCISSADIAKELPPDKRQSLAVARRAMQKMKTSLPVFN